METQIVQQGRAAWERLKKGRANYDDWVLVGHALIEGRKVAMRNAGCSSPAGRGYSDAFGDWLLYNRLDLKPSQRAKLFVVMGILPEVEQWHLTLTPTQRLRMNHPGVVLQNYQKATSIKPPLEHVRPPAPGMRMRPSRRSMQAIHKLSSENS